MSTQSVMDKVRQYLASSSGLSDTSKVAASGAIGQQIKKAASELQVMIESSIPDSIRSSVLVSLSVVFNADCTANINIDIGGSLYRSSLQPETYGGVDNIVGLFSKGWSYPRWAAPSGYWHGQYTYARNQIEASPFINDAVNQWVGKNGGTLKIRSVNVNSMYT